MPRFSLPLCTAQGNRGPGRGAALSSPRSPRCWRADVRQFTLVDDHVLFVANLVTPITDLVHELEDVRPWSSGGYSITQQSRCCSSTSAPKATLLLEFLN